jgi:two-component system response regulator PhoP
MGAFGGALALPGIGADEEGAAAAGGVQETAVRVLIVEDEARLARNIARVLQEMASFAVDISTDGEDGRHMALSSPYDLIILDLMLPKVGGLDIMRRLRSKSRLTPVLILTARDATADVIQGLDLGSDDYMTKPFDMGELVARCKALVRRAYDRPNPVIRIGDLAINTAARTVSFRGKATPLPAMEYRLLEYLAMRAGQVVSKEDIVEHLYDFDSEKFSNVIEVYISALRRRFDPGPKHTLIHTARGQGYLLGEATP